MILSGPYFPSHEQNRLAHEGDVVAARESFLASRPSNLAFLLRRRYAWMDEFLEGRKVALELGAGAGFSKEILRHRDLVLTDYEKRPWIDQQVDALALPFEPSSVDAVVCSHMIHHLASPTKLFHDLHRVLKPGGVVLIQEINTSLLMRLLLRLTRHEGWSYDVDVFDAKAVANDPRDPWSANCAIPQMLFADAARFEARFPGFRVRKNDLNEVLLLPLSGGVIAKARTINLPFRLLRLIDRLDSTLVRLFPSVVALGRSVVLEKRA